MKLRNIRASSEIDKARVTQTNGFLAIDGKVLTYDQMRTRLSFSYPKRIVVKDGVHTTDHLNEYHPDKLRVMVPLLH